MVSSSEAPERRLRMTDLAEQLKIARTRLFYTVGRMEERGWVRREAAPDDGRTQLAVLTSERLKTLEQAAPGHVATVRVAVFDRVTPEQAHTLGDVCEIILDGLTDPDRVTFLPISLVAADILSETVCEPLRPTTYARSEGLARSCRSAGSC